MSSVPHPPSAAPGAVTSAAPDATVRPCLVAEDVAKSYGSTVALAGTSLTIDPGEAVAVMGPSGSGKTTLLHCLSGIVSPTAGAIRLDAGSGAVRVDQLDAAGRARLRRESLSFVFQQGMLVPELTAVENVALPLLLNGVDRGDGERHASRWLTALGLDGLDDRRIGQLSGGQAQRVAIARAQVIDPAIVFADEPTGALDSTTAADVMDALIASTAGRGRTLVVVTHDPDVARSCSRILTLHDGRITSDVRRPERPPQRHPAGQPEGQPEGQPAPAIVGHRPAENGIRSVRGIADDARGAAGDTRGGADR